MWAEINREKNAMRNQIKELSHMGAKFAVYPGIGILVETDRSGEPVIINPPLDGDPRELELPSVTVDREAAARMEAKLEEIGSR
jgi:hypothetical protein